MQSCSQKLLSICEAAKSQPFFVVNNESYDTMMSKLQGGERYVKSYISPCPATIKSKCTCPFFINFLDEEGNMIRVVNGTRKYVVAVRELLSRSGSNAKEN